MKKSLVLLVVLIFLAGPGHLFATTTYLNSLNIPVWATNDDFIAQSMFPQLIPVFSKRFVLEYSGTNIWGYTYLPLLSGNAALILNRPYSGSIANGTNVFGAGYSMNLGSLGRGGFILTFGRNSNDYTELPTDVPKTKGGSENYSSSGHVGLLAGISLHPGMPVDLSLGISFPYEHISSNINDDSGHTIASSLDNSNGFGLSLNGRTRINKFRIYGNINYQYSGRETANKTWGGATYDLLTENSSDESDNKIDIAGGISYPLSPVKGLLIRSGATVDIGYEGFTKDQHLYVRDVSSTTITPEDRWSLNFTLDAFLSGVMNIYKSWYLLGGIRKIIFYSYSRSKSLNQNDKITSAHSNSIFSSQPTSIAMGIRGKIGFIKLDFTLNTNAILNGTYILSGVANSLFARFAISVIW